MAEDISEQNKDILFKVLTEIYKNKSLKVYGLNLPPIAEILPTNLPSIIANEIRADNIFRLVDRTIVIIEYETNARHENLIKYKNYASRVFDRYYINKNNYSKVIVVVIYTGDVKSSADHLDMGSLSLKIEQVFLSRFDGEKMYTELKNKIDNNLEISDEDMLKFIILPLTGKKKDKEEFIENTIELAKKIEDKTMRDFTIAGILIAAYKFIDQKYIKNIGEWIKLTGLARYFEEEKVDYANKVSKEAVKEALDKAAKEKEEAVEAAINEKTKEFTKNILSLGMDLLDVMKVTGLTKAEVLKIQKDIN